VGESKERDDGPFELEIDGLSAGGRGVARSDGRVWFVADAVPGDRVRPRVIRERSRFVEAAVAERVRSSVDRRAPECRYQAECGGCPWMVLPEKVQRSWRHRLVVDALERIGGLEAPVVEEILPAPENLAYRNRAEPTLGLSSREEPVLGFRGEEGGVVDVSHCPVLPAKANEVLRGLRRILLDELGPQVVSALRGSPRFRIGIRVSRATGELLVALYESGVPFPEAAELARRLRALHPEVRGVVRVRTLAGRRGGARVELLEGEGTLIEEVAGLRFRLPAATFLQVNPAVAERLVDRVREWAGDVSGRVVLDLYGGVGVFGLTLAARGARVVVVEADRAAVSCGRDTARRNGLGRVRFRHEDVLGFLRARASSGGRADVVIADPPRTGLGRGVAKAIADLLPARVVLVSCDPATAGRDLKALAQCGYGVRRIVPLDMFPQTAHVETVTVLDRTDVRATGRHRSRPERPLPGAAGSR